MRVVRKCRLHPDSFENGHAGLIENFKPIAFNLRLYLYLGDENVYVKFFRCFGCDETYLPEEVELLPIMRCERCGSALDAEYNYDSIRKEIISDSFRRDTPTHWKYWPFLPVSDLSTLVTMGEGATPLLEHPTLTQSIGAADLHIKYEAQNPTGSFKDRGSSLEITKALELGKKKVVVASTGNMGSSIAAYAAFSNMDCVVFVADVAADVKVAQMRAYGADVRMVDGDYRIAMKEAEDYVRNNNDSFLTGDYPWRCEGTKTVGFEILDQLYWKVPDYVIAPIGNGTLLWSLYEAFRDMVGVGMTDRIPRIIGVQAEGCNCVVQAWEDGVQTIEPINNPKTVATAIACGDPIDGLAALRALRESDGLGVSVSDDEIIAARSELARHGILVEPSGAVSYAGALKVKDVLVGQTVVCIATGHGLKDMQGL